VYGLPLDDTFRASSSFTRPGETDNADSPSAGMRIVTPDYFSTMKIPLRSGRPFDAHDDENGPEVVAINEEAARRYWPGINPLGQQLHLGVRMAEARSGHTRSIRWTRSPSPSGPRAIRWRSSRWRARTSHRLTANSRSPA
jgi:hypothetical protein